ncbi:Methyltransferase type 11 [Nostoc sp. NIES-3756]|uniref:class I SAM-dependent methyltransferase n=1 Tax=Nostoc sp. NIES-3756 TaxID=1751286 RepID=UPI000720CED0|nr:class I SAM-dependent methyltransferase [Nostoc sp. NIES-3756]BAT55552.1 Methyltransferase type 11 [Nostoc sp. NIES-3756]
MLHELTVKLPYFFATNNCLDSWNEDIFICKIINLTPAIEANSYYFGHSEWSKNYFEACHRDEKFIELWQAVIGSWQGKVVVDIGCGPGNLYGSLRKFCGEPELLIGVDVSLGALKMAQKLSYTSVLADAHNLPFISEFADIVMLNACLHHCDDMPKVLAEAARLVRPGGILITDHDPQQTAYQLKAMGWLLWQLRLPIYRFIKRGGHSTPEEQFWSIASEVHHKPGHGVTPKMFHEILEPLKFTVKIYPHNHNVGAKALQKEYGRAFWQYRLAQRLSGIDPNLPESALSLMCVATRQS